MKLLCLLFFSVFYSATSLANTISVSEADLYKMIIKENSLVKAGRSQIESLQARTGHFKRSFAPKLSLYAGQESFKYVIDDFKSQPFYGAELAINLFNGGKDNLKDKMGEVALEKGKSEQKINVFAQLEDSRKTFWRAVYLESLMSLFDKSLELTKKNRKAAVRRIKSGVATKSDKFEFDIKEVELRQDKKRASLDFEVEISRLKILLGLKQTQKLTLKQDLTHNHGWRNLFKHSETDHNYLVKPQEFEIENVRLKSKLSRKSWYPKIDAQAQWLQNNQRNDFDRANDRDRRQTAIGLKATWNISNFVSGNVESKSSLAMERANIHKLNFQKKELESELHLELKELELLDSMVHDAEENIKRSKSFFKLITSEYNRGVKTSGDMLMATEKLISSEVRKILIIKDFHLARAHIMAKLGR